MKKILISITIFLSIILFTNNVNASSFNVNIVGDDTFEKEITLYVQINDLVDFNGSCSGLCGLVANLNYDDEKLELIDTDTLEDFDLMKGKKLVLYKPTGVLSGTKILSLKFKNKSLNKDETTTISLTNITASDGDKDINTNNISKTIKLIEKEQKEEDNKKNNNTLKTTTTKKISVTKTTKKTESKKSNNNFLSSIILSNGTIKFDKNILEYDIFVDYEIANIEIKAEKENNKATIIGCGNYDLQIGDNLIKIDVVAEDKSIRTYTLNINREEKENVNNKEENTIKEELVKKENTNNLIPILITVFILIGGVTIIIINNKKKNN